MHPHLEFVGNLLGHLVAWMSGAVSFLFSVWEHYRGKKLEARIFFTVGLLCLIFAADQAWQDEHRNSDLLGIQKAAMSSELGFWKDQNYAKDAAIRSRDELLSQNYSALIGQQKAANGSQQALARLSEKILELQKPEKQEFTFARNHGDPRLLLGWPQYTQFVIFTNLPARTHIDIVCDVPFEIVDARNLDGGPHFDGSTRQIAANHWLFSNPIIMTSKTPVLVLAVSKTELGLCSTNRD